MLKTTTPTAETADKDFFKPTAPFSWLVLPSSHVVPDIPFDVASTLGLIVAVFLDLVVIVVANVSVEGFPDSPYAPEERKTRAAPGAGTVT